jgi:hypothetical protein
LIVSGIFGLARFQPDYWIVVLWFSLMSMLLLLLSLLLLLAMVTMGPATDKSTFMHLNSQTEAYAGGAVC